MRRPVDADRIRAFMRAIVALKERLELNIELAAPDRFIPELEGWRERSPFVTREGHLDFHHYDLYAETLAKIERGHTQDREDVCHMIDAGLVDPTTLLRRYQEIEPQLFRFPAIDAAAFRRSVESTVSDTR